MMDDKTEKTILQMLKTETSERRLVKAFSIYKLNSSNIFARILTAIIFIAPSLLIGFQNTVQIMSETLEIVMNVLLALFGVVFTGYVFLQALFNAELVKLLIESVDIDKHDKVEKSKLQETNEKFLSLMMLFLVAIFISFLLRIIILGIPESYLLFPSIIANEIIAVLLIEAYFYFIGVILWNMVSFIFNLFQLFNMYAVSKYVKAMEQERIDVENESRGKH
jgi:hypothetical protein